MHSSSVARPPVAPFCWSRRAPPPAPPRDHPTGPVAFGPPPASRSPARPQPELHRALGQQPQRPEVAHAQVTRLAERAVVALVPPVDDESRGDPGMPLGRPILMHGGRQDQPATPEAIELGVARVEAFHEKTACRAFTAWPSSAHTVRPRGPSTIVRPGASRGARDSSNAAAPPSGTPPGPAPPSRSHSTRWPRSG